jgi:ligand-binding sensor domain-containing protein
MTAHEPLTDIELEAMLARLTERAWTDGLEESIMTAVETTPRQRARWLAWPSWPIGTRPELRPLGYVAIIGLLLALAAGTIVLGTRFLHRTPQIPDPRTVLVPAFVETLSEAGTYQETIVDDDGFLWTAGRGTLTRYDPATGAGHRWTVDDDFQFAAVSSVEPAQAGGVWLIGRQTLLRFDGTSFGDMVEVGDDVTTATEAPDGTLWVAASDSSLIHVVGSSQTRIAVPRPSADAAISAIAVDQTGNVWCGWMEGELARGWVTRFDGATWQTFDERSAAPLAGGVLVIAPTSDGDVWVGTASGSATDATGAIHTNPGGLAYFDGATWVDVSAGQAALHDASVTSVAADADGSIWVGFGRPDGSPGVAQRRGDAWTAYGTDDGLPGADETSFARVQMVLAGGRVFAGTGTGVFGMADNRWVRIWPETAPAGPDDLGPERLVAISRDEAWVATWGHVWRYSGGAWSAPMTPQSSGNIRDLLVTADGTAWIAADDGVYVQAGSSWTRVTREAARSLGIDRDGRIWASTYSQASLVWYLRAYVLDHGTWTEVDRLQPVAPDRPMAPADHLAFGDDGTIWAGSGGAWGYAGGLVRYAEGAWEQVHPNGGDGELIVTGLTVAANGDVWVIGADVSTSTTNVDGVRTGETISGEHWIARFDGTRWSTYQKAYRGPALSVGGTLLAAAPDGAIWAATEHGLARFDGISWSDVRTEAAYRAVSVAPDGTVWVVGPSGFGRLTEVAAP